MVVIESFQQGRHGEVNEENTVKTTLEEARAKRARGQKGRTDWVRVDALTDEEIEAAVRDDPDAAPLTDEKFWEDAEVVMP